MARRCPQGLHGNAAKGRKAWNWAVPATVSGERMSTRPKLGRSHWEFSWEGGHDALTREASRPAGARRSCLNQVSSEHG